MTGEVEMGECERKEEVWGEGGCSKKECEAEGALEEVRVVEAKGDVREGLSKEMGRGCSKRTGE